MASDLERGCTEQIINRKLGHVFYQAPGTIALTSEVFAKSSKESNINTGAASPPSAYTLATDDSLYLADTRRCSYCTEDTAVQNSRVVLVQAETLARSSSLDNSVFMYIMALFLPLISANTLDVQWRCTPSAVIRTSELFLVKLARLIAQARAYIRGLADDQISRDLFATAMDIVLVVYAIGFLFLSLYQASIFS